jgi:hypothetical protein
MQSFIELAVAVVAMACIILAVASASRSAAANMILPPTTHARVWAASFSVLMGGLLVASAQKSRLESDHLVGILLWCRNQANNHTTKPLRPPTIDMRSPRNAASLAKE